MKIEITIIIIIKTSRYKKFGLVLRYLALNKDKVVSYISFSFSFRRSGHYIIFKYTYIQMQQK